MGLPWSFLACPEGLPGLCWASLGLFEGSLLSTGHHLELVPLVLARFLRNLLLSRVLLSYPSFTGDSADLGDAIIVLLF